MVGGANILSPSQFTPQEHPRHSTCKKVLQDGDGLKWAARLRLGSHVPRVCDYFAVTAVVLSPGTVLDKLLFSGCLQSIYTT